VGLDYLDASALWVMVLYFGYGFGQDPIKYVFKCSDLDALYLSLSFFCWTRHGQRRTRVGTKLDETPTADYERAAALS
jgi:hypothetical protein